MSIEVELITPKGGVVCMNQEHGVRVSYAVATVDALAPQELLYVWMKLPSGRSVQLFVNRESGLIVVDVVDKRGVRGNEVLRCHADKGVA